VVNQGIQQRKIKEHIMAKNNIPAAIATEESLAVKYRPSSLDDLVGQDEIVRQVRGMIKRGRIPRTMLVTGDTGLGKTTLARIIAHTITGISFDIKNHPDIIEVNSAGERKIEDVRNMVQQIKFLPSIGKVKVFILDECHALTKDSVSLLLKHLEEPPAHVAWILATNEPHRLLETVRNRAETLVLRRPTLTDIIKLLLRVAEKEDVFQPPAKYKLLYKAVAEASGGTPRTALSILGKIININAEKSIKGKDTEDIEAALKDAMRTLDISSDKVAVLILLSLYQGKGAALSALGDTQDYQSLSMHLLELHTHLIESMAKIAKWQYPIHALLKKHMEEQDVKPSLSVMALIQLELLELRQRILMSTMADRHVMIGGIANILVKVRALLKPPANKRG